MIFGYLIYVGRADSADDADGDADGDAGADAGADANAGADGVGLDVAFVVDVGLWFGREEKCGFFFSRSQESELCIALQWSAKASPQT